MVFSRFEHKFDDGDFGVSMHIFSYGTLIGSIIVYLDSDRKFKEFDAHFDSSYYSPTTTRHQGVALAFIRDCIIDKHVYHVGKRSVIKDLTKDGGYIKKSDWLSTMLDYCIEEMP